MRKFILAATFLTVVQPAFAASPDVWQKGLQNNLQGIAGSSANVKADGAVTVEPSNGYLRATFPVITVKNADGSTWKIPSIVMVRPADKNSVAVTLPSMITQLDGTGKAGGQLMIGKQNLTGQWNDATSRFDQLNGMLQNVNVQKSDPSTKAAINAITIATPTASSLRVGLDNVQGSSFIDAKTRSVQIGHVDYSYDFKGAKGMGLEQILGLLQQNYLAQLKTPVTMTAHATNVSYQNEPDKTDSISDIKAEVLVTPKGDNKNADVRNHIELSGISRNPAMVNSLLLPKRVEMTGTVLSLPLAMLSMSPTNNTQTLKQQMADAGTVVNFEDIRMDTAQGGKVTGRGQLKANATTPTGFTGLVNFKMENINSVMANLQKQASAPGANMAAQGQALMAMFMLQGMGTTQSNGTVNYVLNLTPQGQVLVNDKDISTLVNMGMGMKGGSAAVMPMSGPDAARAVGNGANALGGLIQSFIPNPEANLPESR